MSRAVRVLRGGSWDNDYQDDLRASWRLRTDPSSRYYFVGFRCVREAMARDRRTVRGGCWSYDAQSSLRAPGRYRYVPSYWLDYVGVRCVRGVAQ